MIYTLAYDGTTQTLAEWGLADDFVWNEKVSDVSTITLVAADLAIDAALLFAYGETVTVLADDVAVFVGTVTELKRQWTGSREQHTYVVSDAFWFLKQITYAQTYHVLTTPPSTYTDTPTECVQLFRDNNGDPVTNGATIQDVIAWAIARGAPLQLGTVDLDTEPIADQQTSISCHEALMRCMAWTPNSMARLDYTTDPPTFHCVKQASAATVSVALTAMESPITITPRHDLQMAYVRVAYIATGADPINHALDVDLYPADADEDVLPNLRESVDTTPESGHQEEQEIVTQDFSPSDGAWWKANVLKDENIGTVTVTGVDVLVEPTIGTSMTPGDYPRQLVSGTVAEWMPDPLVGLATVQATLEYDYSDDARVVHHVKSPHTIEVAGVTNLNANGGHTYRHWVVDEIGDEIPEGVAQALYTALAVLQYEGRLVIHGEECDLTLRAGKKLNVTGGPAAWATMAAKIVEVNRRPHNGYTELVIGQPAHLAARDYVALIRYARSRGKPGLLDARTGN